MLNKTFKYPIVLILLLNVNQLFAQSKWSLGGSASIDYSYRFNEKGNERFFFSSDKTINDFENGSIGFNGGIKIKFDVNKVISLIGGVSYLQNNFYTSDIYLTPIDPNDALIPNYFTLSYRKDYVQLPLLASFYWGNKWKFGLTTGFACNISTKQEITSHLYFLDRSNSSSSSNQLTKAGNDAVTVFGILGFGTEYSYKKYIYRFEPTFNGKIFDISPKTDLYPWNLGANISVFFKL